MAVKEKEALYEEVSSDSSLWHEEEKEEEEEEEDSDADYMAQLHELRKRISQTYPLNEEVLGVLHTALLSLNSPSKLHHDNSLLSPLLRELKSLRNLIPPAQGDEGSASCVITDALNYLEQRKRVMKSLKEGIQESLSLSGGSSEGEGSPIEAHSFGNVDYGGLVKVESISNAKLSITFNSKKSEGLLSRLILALDTLGLVMEQMDITCNDVFMMEAITTKVGEKMVDDESVKEVLWKIIHQGL